MLSVFAKHAILLEFSLISCLLSSTITMTSVGIPIHSLVWFFAKCFPAASCIYFLQVRLGKNGVEEVLGLGQLSDYEQESLEKLKPELKSSIEKGIKFAA